MLGLLLKKGQVCMLEDRIKFKFDMISIKNIGIIFLFVVLMIRLFNKQKIYVYR